MSNLLTVCVPNRDRLANNNETKLFFRSLAWQTNKNFDFIIVDGGSKNIKDWQKIANEHMPRLRIISRPVVGEFNKPLLNNIGIRSAKTPYILTTDADIMFAPKFIEKVMGAMREGNLIEFRTMYWKEPTVKRIFSGEVDPERNLDACKDGRIKKRTTCGGCQCMHINDWTKIRGYDERFTGWGSEDQDLMTRARMAKIREKWIGESMEGIMLFHMPHFKDKDLVAAEYVQQERNKNMLYHTRSIAANPEGWGDIPDTETV